MTGESRPPFELLSLEQMLERADDEDRACRSVQPPAVKGHCDCEAHHRDTRWTGWELCAVHQCLVHDGYGYCIDLIEITTPAEMLDWVFQIRGKGWTEGKSELTGMLQAFYDILNPQSTLCGGGRSRRLTRRVISARVKAVTDAWPLDPEPPPGG